MTKKIYKNKLFFAIFIYIFFVLPYITNASETEGVIGSNAKYAWSDNLGWINFAPAKGGVSITDTSLTGSAWSNNNGWINFAPAKGGVLNDGQGNLSGSAWGEQTGWIDFSGVSIDSEGKFKGAATGVVAGTLTFDCNQCDVKTDWRPQSARVRYPLISHSDSPIYPNIAAVVELNDPQPQPITSNFYQTGASSVTLSGLLDSSENITILDNSTSSLYIYLKSTTTNGIEKVYQKPANVIKEIGSIIKNTFDQVIVFTQNIFYGVVNYIKDFFGFINIF